ncbi:MFS transporter [Brevibacterium sp. FAM 24638]|uniref:MFS transporter n=1 Tax=Brevibacterium sp. FAM 24638 TaxID=3415681 RepID=UPI003C7CED87
MLADVFFPPEAGASAVLAALAVYGVAFVARPLSAFFFGWVGDRFGRRNALSLSILIMGVATACISPQCSFVASLALGR